jgi:hypothetical protein
MSKTKTKKQEEEQSSSGVSGVLLVVVGIALLAGLYAWATTWREEAAQARELPLVSIALEVDKFDQNARSAIVQLEAGLKATGVFGNPLGPADVKFLVPGAKPGDIPLAKEFGDLTDDEWAKAWSYVAKTDYLVPRMFRLDGTACVIRLDPKGGFDFAPDAAAKLQQACEPFKRSFKGFHVYSRALEVGTVHDRDVLNASFGCQLAFVFVHKSSIKNGATPAWRTADGIKTLSAVKDAITNKHFRSITTAASLVRYYWTVLLQRESQVDVPTIDTDVKLALDFAKANGISPLMTGDGVNAIVDTTTDLEGQPNVELMYYLMATLQNDMKLDVTTPYAPAVKTPLKNIPMPIFPR